MRGKSLIASSIEAPKWYEWVWSSSIEFVQVLQILGFSIVLIDNSRVLWHWFFEMIFFLIFKTKIMWISLARLCLKNCFKKYILKIQFFRKKNYFLPAQKQQVFGTETHKIIPNSCLVSVSLSFLNTMLFVSTFFLVWHAHLYALGVLMGQPTRAQQYWVRYGLWLIRPVYCNWA